MHQIQLAVFDMAGTVVNENNVVYKTLQKSINEYGIDVSLNFVLEYGAGKEKLTAIKDIIKEAQGIPDEVMANTIFEYFKVELERAYAQMDVCSYAEVEELLAYLRERGVKVALNTGYDRNIAQLLINKMNWKQGEQFDLLITSDDVISGRPNPAMIFEAMNFFNIKNPALVLKAGDSIIDIEEGKNAKCGITVGVTTGAHTYEQLMSAEPTYVLRKLAQLKGLLGLE